MVIFDTNILIELYKGNTAIQQEIRLLNADVFYISSITFAEFIVGAKDKAEIRKLERILENYTLIPLTEPITEIFIDLFKTFTLSHRPSIPDTLIAATALYYNLPLYTLNKRHFQFIPGINLV